MFRMQRLIEEDEEGLSNENSASSKTVSNTNVSEDSLDESKSPNSETIIISMTDNGTSSIDSCSLTGTELSNTITSDEYPSLHNVNNSYYRDPCMDSPYNGNMSQSNRMGKYSPEEEMKRNNPLMKNIHMVPESGGLNADEECKELKGFAKIKYWMIHRMVTHIAFTSIIIILLLVDLCVIIADLSTNGAHYSLKVVSLSINAFFFLEVCLRIWARGLAFFKSMFDILDLLIILVGLAVTIIAVIPGLASGVKFAKLITFGRALRVVVLFRIIAQQKRLQKTARHTVGENKRRWVDDDYDIDLCYITRNVLAMSFPESGVHQLFRNDIGDVSKFLDSRHPGKYRVYNLCSEKDYNEAPFHNNVYRVMIPDHNVPTLKQMLAYVDDVNRWMTLNKDNVIVIHCKGGKGRTGTMVCVWLLANREVDTGEHAAEYFGFRRTDKRLASKFQGIETPSQIRFVGYYEKLRDSGLMGLPPVTPMKIVSMKITGLQNVGPGNGRDLRGKISNKNRDVNFEIEEGINVKKYKFDPITSTMKVSVRNCFELIDEVRLQFWSAVASVPIGYEDCVFFFWFHTWFIENNRLTLTRAELDNPHKEDTHHVFGPDFSITLKFVSLPQRERRKKPRELKFVGWDPKRKARRQS